DVSRHRQMVEVVGPIDRVIRFQFMITGEWHGSRGHERTRFQQLDVQWTPVCSVSRQSSRSFQGPCHGEAPPQFESESRNSMMAERSGVKNKRARIANPSLLYFSPPMFLPFSSKAKFSR